MPGGIWGDVVGGSWGGDISATGGAAPILPAVKNPRTSELAPVAAVGGFADAARPAIYPDDLPSSRATTFDGTQERWERAKANAAGAAIGLSVVSGGLIVRWAVRSVTAWLFASTAVTQADKIPVPTLTTGSGRDMPAAAIGHLRGIPGSLRAEMFGQLAEQITKVTNGQWSATPFNAINARIFAGEYGHALVFDVAGNMFRGNINSPAFQFQTDGTIRVVFDLLTRLWYLMSLKMLLNEDEAFTVLSSITEPVTKNLVALVVARARMRCIRYDGESEEDWARRLPVGPFDMHFLVQILPAVFAKQEIIRDLLDGKTLDEASGWDV
jgi:hypothetical protein